MKDYTGFYSLDGDVCRIVADETSFLGVRAEMYVPKHGFAPIEISMLLDDGIVITETAFKNIIKQGALKKEVL